MKVDDEVYTELNDLIAKLENINYMNDTTDEIKNMQRMLHKQLSEKEKMGSWI